MGLLERQDGGVRVEVVDGVDNASHVLCYTSTMIYTIIVLDGDGRLCWSCGGEKDSFGSTARGV